MQSVSICGDLCRTAISREIKREEGNPSTWLQLRILRRVASPYDDDDGSLEGEGEALTAEPIKKEEDAAVTVCSFLRRH